MFTLEKFMDKRVLKSSFLEDENGLIAFFTTRDLPLKAGEREDLIEQVEENKKFLCKCLDIPEENLFIPEQTHSDNVIVVNGKRETVNREVQETISSRFTLHPSPFEDTDALITNQQKIAIALNFADCVPIILYDPIKKVVAIAHAGWKGTASSIARKTVEKMKKEFLINPKDIIALIGPAIGKCCFEVKNDVAQKLLQTIDLSEHDAVYYNEHIDLKLVNKIQLLSSGVEKIDVCEYCTCCNVDLLFSYRKENGNTARHSAVVMLK